MASKEQRAIEFINQKGALLAFPIKNQKEPNSLWSCLHPRSEMIWAWDADADGKVSELWRLMKKLSANPKVVYSKWYQGRATFFSREVFSALLGLTVSSIQRPLSYKAAEILEALESDSPLSTRDLKEMVELQGRHNQKFFDQAMKQLFQSFLIVGFGEVEDGSFPSLAVGATNTLYEELWRQAKDMKSKEAWSILRTRLGENSKFLRFFVKTHKARLA